jgi:hypothetical protein
MSDLATSFATDTCGGDLLPLSPFDSLRYHFGMLLGVDDFETEQAYHRAKMRLHNAWLHRQGVVWGFGVRVDNDHGEIRVKPGLALDAAGHELHLDADYCINVSEWFDKHENDAGFNLVRDGFDVHVVICFKACLNHQVPTLLEPCDNGGTGTTYSRVHETLDIRLLPQRAADPVYPYHRLRLLFGIDAPQTLDQAKLDELRAREDSEEEKALLEAVKRDQDVLDEINRIAALPAAEQSAAWVKAFHQFAALDEIDLQPATSEDGARQLLFPGQENDCLLLADITELKLTRKDDKWLLNDGKVDTSVRPSHVATTTIQDLLCGRLGAANGTPDGDSGPRVVPTSISLSTSRSIIFSTDKALAEASVNPAAFSVSFFDLVQGWKTANVTDASYGGAETNTVSLELDTDISGLVRLIVSGTGPTPLLGADLVPLAGAVGGLPAGRHNGHDFVYMKEFVAEPDESPAKPPDENNIKASDDSQVVASPKPLKPKKKTSRK